MKKTLLNNDVATPLVEKLTQDTLEKNIEWVRKPIDEHVEIPHPYVIPLTTAHKDYHFEAEIREGVICHFQHLNSIYFIWVVGPNDSMAAVASGLYNMPVFAEKVISLSRAIRKVTHDEGGIVENIMNYIGR